MPTGPPTRGLARGTVARSWGRCSSTAAGTPNRSTWQASWRTHVGGPAPLGGVLASAIDAGNREIAAILRDSLQGRHPVSGPSSQAYAALLAADDPAGWEVVETLLVSAQRAEGLRQAILEAADVAHPEAFARLLSRVVELDLSRFAGTVRAVGVWFGDELTVRQGRVVSDALRTTLGFLQRTPSAADLREADAATAYLGLWTLAVRDAPTVPVAAALLNHSDQGHRLAAARLLTDLALPSAGEELVCGAEDPALPVYAAAVAAWPDVDLRQGVGRRAAPAGPGRPHQAGRDPWKDPRRGDWGTRPPGPEGGRCACG